MDSLAALASAARASSAPEGMSTRIVAIDGLGGAGKSTLAGRLAERLDGAPVVHTDDFASWEIPIDWWPRLVEQVLDPLAVGRAGRYQRYDWDTEALAEWIDVPTGGFVVLEGVSAAREAFRPYLTLSIWVETGRDERLRRGLARDGEHLREKWLQWMADEDAYVAREQPQHHVDVVLDGTHPLPD